MNAYDDNPRARAAREAFLAGNPVFRRVGYELEVGESDNGHYALRAQGVTLYYNQNEWDAFLAGVKDGEFDADQLAAQPTI